jgi:predicted ATPase
MLTRLRVQGFKNLLDVDIRFGPFNCVAGPNAAGKSNLFDAIRFLSLLTQYSIMESVRLLREARGKAPNPRSLFTAFGDFRSSEMRFTADLVIDRAVQDEFGSPAKASISTLRYEVAFRLASDDGVERLELASESLSPVSQEKARQELGFPAYTAFKNSVISGRRSAPFISTSGDSIPRIRVHQEGHGGRIFAAPKSSKTILGGTNSYDFPTILAAHREMESWRTLLLEPSAMRGPSHYTDPRFIDSRGANLPAAIERLRKQEHRKGEVYSELSNRLAELIEDIRDLRVSDDERTETLTLEVTGRDGVRHPASSLSDGTLRFLVLAAMAIDAEAEGLICLEEPENGIHPERIPAMVKLLRDIATDPRYMIGTDNPLRQVIMNTHSPVVISCLDVDDLIYLDRKQVRQESAVGKVALVRVPEGGWRAKISDSAVVLPLTPGQLNPYQRTLDGQILMPLSSR